LNQVSIIIIQGGNYNETIPIYFNDDYSIGVLPSCLNAALCTGMVGIYYSMSSNERKQIDDANNNYLKKAIKAGAILEFYGIPGWNRHISIEQYDSIDELYNHFEGDPIYPYIKFEVYPLQKAEIMTDVAGKTKSNSKMKFLVINEAKDIWYAMPVSERKKIEETNTTYITKAIKAGDFLGLYSIPGWNRAASIEQYDSIASLYNHFEGDPYYPYAKFEIYPLVEIDLTK